MATPRKTSLFAQRLQTAKESKLKTKNVTENIPVVENRPAPSISANFGDKSVMVEGLDAETIHKENVLKLASMTPAEIEEERRKLLTTMDPSMIQFLKSRRKRENPGQNVKPEETSVGPTKMDCSESSTVVEEVPAAMFVNKYPHMDVVEPEKLQWMKDVQPPKPLENACPYNARFNFEGELLPYVDEKLTEGLHHHGDEPERPGYTLQELMQLSRSSMLQQRITAISTLANIFHKASDYDYCLEKPLLPQLLDSELYLLLRFTLDDVVRSVVSAAIAAVSSLLVNTKDEGCLDRLLGLSTGLRQPSLYVHLEIKPDELAELKDTELLKVDVVRGALRTHLLPRFRYILDKLNPETVEIAHIMRCLVRIARHSYEAALSISNSPGLLTAALRILEEGPPRALSEGMKLFRVLACQSRGLASYIIENYNIMGCIQRFIAGGLGETNVSLTLESFYTWQTFLNYHLTTNHVSPFMPVVQRLLVTYADSISLDSGSADCEHAAALCSWLACLLRADPSCVQPCLPALQLCALKWLSQARNISSIKWAACKMLEAVLQATALLILQGIKNLDIQNKVDAFLRSDNFSNISQRLRRSSWLLRGEKSPSVVESLPCLGSVPPTLYDDSPLPLLMGLTVYVFATKSPQLSERLACCEGVQRYLEEVVKEGEGVKARAAHWFARQEIALLYTLLQVSLNTQNPVENSINHQVALFLSTSIHADDRYMLCDLFDQVVFNKHFFRSDLSDITTILQNLNLNSENKTNIGRKEKLLSEALDSLDTISSCYQRELGLEGLGAAVPPPTLTSTPHPPGVGPALPADWHFLPIVQLNNIDGKREDAASVAVSCLQWSLVLECLRPQYLSRITVESRFCRLACILLAGSDLFREVREWLKAVLKALLVYNSTMDFNASIPGLKSFYDFYRQILEQFVGVSYGDAVFGQFVLIPLQQRHSLQLRKLVWCEMGAVLRFLSTPLDNVGVPIENFLEPCETDVDLLLIYLRALGQGKVRSTFCPVLYKVAVHHVATFVSRFSEQLAAKRLSQMIQALGNQELKSLLINYCSTTSND